MPTSFPHTLEREMQNEALQRKLEDAIIPKGVPAPDESARHRASSVSPEERDDDRGNRVSLAKKRDDNRVAMPSAQADGDIEAILSERQATHGDFTDNARVMQGLKRVLWNEKGWDRLTDVQREALEMIVHKCGRIISGNPNEPDHWNDIAGYAKLAANRIK